MAQLLNKVILEEKAVGSPAIVGNQDLTLLLAWTGTDDSHHLNLTLSTDEGQSFGPPDTLTETSFDGPSLASGIDFPFLGLAEMMLILLILLRGPTLWGVC